MASDWRTKGCQFCRDAWEQGRMLPQLAESEEWHSFLHRCPQCQTYWEQFERYADTIGYEEAKLRYGCLDIDGLDHRDE